MPTRWASSPLLDTTLKNFKAMYNTDSCTWMLTEVLFIVQLQNQARSGSIEDWIKKKWIQGYSHLLCYQVQYIWTYIEVFDPSGVLFRVVSLHSSTQNKLNGIFGDSLSHGLSGNFFLTLQVLCACIMDFGFLFLRDSYVYKCVFLGLYAFSLAYFLLFVLPYSVFYLFDLFLFSITLFYYYS